MLNVVTGVMKSGKSLEAINLIDKIQRSDNAYTVIARDDITSRSIDKTIKADYSRVPSWIKLTNYKYIIVDECQFLDEHEILNLIEASRMRDVYCFGILKDYEGIAFESMTDLIANADNVKVLETFCDRCKRNKASHHLKTKDSDDLKRKDIYESVCYDCFAVCKGAIKYDLV